jgi:hypothetical protein
LLGDAYLIVWADVFGRPAESDRRIGETGCRADRSRQPPHHVCREAMDQDDDRTVLYLPDRIVRLRANQTGPTTQGFATVEELTNPLGTAPVVNLRDSDRILDEFGSSEINDLKPLGDALNKSLADMMVTSEYVGWPRRWATSIALTEEPIIGEDGRPTIEVVEVNPIPEGARAMISQNDQAKFGQPAAADLAGYEASVRVILGQIMAVSTLPAHVAVSPTTRRRPMRCALLGPA